jgi:acetylornithine deacetylase/succinyl-diaminopimelate desuccinylase-like protein
MIEISVKRRALLAAAASCAFSSPASAQTREAALIERLADRGDVQQAMAAIVAGEAQDLRDLVELTEIPAPPFGEEARAACFAEMLREAGLSDVAIDEVGNVIARRRGRGRGPTLALIAHLDTVFPAETDVRVRVEGDTYRAPGIGDNSRGLVYLLSLARAMNGAAVRTRGDILFVGSVGEEGLGDLRGVKHLFRPGGPRIDAALIIDGGLAGRIVNVAVGSVRYRVIVTGPGGHSWGAFGMANPHHALGRIIARFDEAATALVSAGGPKATYNVGRLGGGTSVNSIPFESWMEVDMRSADPAALAALDQALQSAAAAGLEEENSARAHGPALQVEMRRVGVRPAGVLSPETPLVRAAVAAMARFGVTAEFEEASTDANVPISLGIPAITVSRGGESGAAHAPEEWWRNVNSHVAPQIGLLIAIAATGG